MNYDKILLELGEFGPWQRTNTFLLGIPFFVAGMNIILTSFTVMEPRNGFRCKIMQCDGPNFKFCDFSAEEIFPSMDPNNKENYNPINPIYCETYQHYQVEGKCFFNHSTVTFA